MFDNFWGNAHVAQALEQMIAQQRLAQTLLFSGPEGIGKATLARRVGARAVGCMFGLAPHSLSTVSPDRLVQHASEWPEALGL